MKEYKRIIVILISIIIVLIIDTYNADQCNADQWKVYVSPYYRSIHEHVQDEAIRQQFLQVLELFYHEELQQVSEALDQLPPDHEFSNSFKQDFKTSLLFAEGDYHGALESLIRRHDAGLLSDEQYLRDLAHMIYYFRRIKGQRAVKQSIKTLQQQYDDNRISLVWMAIHPGALDRLLKSDLYPYQSLHEKQLEILRNIVEKYPDDPCLDYAYYFLHQYDKIITDFPHSPILDRAYYAHAYLPYYQYVLKGEQPVSREELLEIANRFAEFIRKFPTNTLAIEAYPKLLTCYLNLPDAEESFQRISGLHTQIQELAQQGIMSTTSFNRLKHQLALQFFNERNYGKSAEFYDMLPDDYPLEPQAIPRKKALHKIVALEEEPGSKDYLLKIGFILKETRYDAEHAVPFFDQYLEQFAHEDEVPKFLMLKAFCYRDAGKSTEMLDLYQRVIDQYPESDLADDALAEIGAYYLLWQKDGEEARRVFSEVLERYPHGNAFDNSYNWIAWSYLRDYQCLKALETYQQIQQKFPFTRFSRYAVTAIEKIEKFSASPYQAGERVLVKHEAPWLGFIYGEPTASDIGNDGYWTRTTVLRKGACCYTVQYGVTNNDYSTNDCVSLDRIKADDE